MRIPVLYATVEGQTRRIAAHAAAHLAAAGHDAPLVEANAEGAAGALAGADAALLAAPIHAGRYPSPFVHLVAAERPRLGRLPTAFVSVTLAIIGEPDERREAEAFPGRLAELTGWRAGAVHHAAGALRFAEYDFFKRWIMRRIARAHGHGDGTDREFTDWPALDAFLDRFLADLPPGPATAAG